MMKFHFLVLTMSSQYLKFEHSSEKEEYEKRYGEELNRFNEK